MQNSDCSDLCNELSKAAIVRVIGKIVAKNKSAPHLVGGGRFWKG